MVFDPSKVDLSSLSEVSSGEQIDVVDDSLDLTMSEAVKINPDQHAKVVNLSRETGVPEFAVEQNVEQVEQDIKKSEFDFSGLRETNPKTALYFDEFSNAIIAQDDVDTLKSIENIFDFGKTFDNFKETSLLGFESQSAGAMIAGVDMAPDKIQDLIPMSALPIGMQLEAPNLSRQLAKNMGIDTDEQLQKVKEDSIEQLITEIRSIQKKREDLTPEDLNLLEQGVRSGFESLVNMAPGTALMLASGGRAAPLLFTIGAQTFGDTFGEGRAEGLTPEQSAWFAGINTVIEVGTEILPTGTLETIITGKSTGMKKAALKFLVQEMGTEQLATLGQSITSYLFGLDEQMENATVEEMVQIQLQRQAVTAIATVVAGGAQIAAATGVRKSVEALTQNDNAKETKGQIEQRKIDELNEKSEGSKLRERDKESFRQFVEEADGENNTHVFIDGVQTSLYLQGKTREEIEADPALKTLSEQAREAAAIGGDVQIPVADFAADFAGTDHFAELRDSMTMSDETVSPFRQDQVKQETETYISKLMEEAQENTSEYVEAQEIYNTVRDQLVDTGQVTPANASIMAQIVPAWATAQAARQGKTVSQVYEAAGLTIEGPQTGERARLEGEQVLSEGPFAQPVLSDILDEFESLFPELVNREMTAEEIAAAEKIQGEIDSPDQGSIFKIQEAKDKRDELNLPENRTKVAGFTPERIQRMLSESVHVNGEETRSRVAYIDPIDFVAATHSDVTKIEAESTELDVEQLSAQEQTPYLIIETSGEIIGHEGRHRMMALAKAGFKSVPVVIRQPEYTSESSDMNLKGQSFQDGKGIDLKIKNAVPVLPENVDQFTDEKADLLFQPPVERRRAAGSKARELFDKMTREELINELLKHELTGIKGRKAFVVDVVDAPFIGSIDADSLKWINDNLSPDHGDALLQAVADALESETDGAYHISGDEFYVLGDTQEEVQSIIDKVTEKLSSAIITATKPDGTVITLNGLNITYGLGDTKDVADQKLKQEKVRREESGERASRGEQPLGSIIRSAEGIDPDGDVSEVDNKLFQPDDKNLFVAHNLSAENILSAADLGGLAAPSIAIARSDISDFTGFGEVTLLADPELLNDPKARTFDADVYSPRQPRAVYDIDQDVYSELYQQLDPDNLQLSKPDIQSLEDTQGADNLLRSGAVEYHWLKLQGKEPKIKNAKVEPIIRKADKLGLDRFEMESDPKFIKLVSDYYQASLDALTEEGFDVRVEKMEGWYFNEDGTIKKVKLRDMASKVSRFRDTGGKDVSQLRNDIVKKIRVKKNRVEYEQWVTKQFNSMVKGKKLFKGFTPSGNRRYVDYNLQNVVKEMTQQLQAGESFFYGAGTVRSKYANEMKTIAQIQAKRDEIVSEEDMQKVKDESDDVFSDALDALKPFYKYDTGSFGYADDAGNAIIEGRKGLNEAFNMTEEAQQIVDDLLEYLVALPTSYFESKIQRAVGFDEFNTAVVPRGMRKDALKVLKDAGLKIKTYNPKDKGSRAEVIAKQEKLLFQPTKKKSKARGYYDPANSIIRLQESADLSTFLHEFAHFMYEMELTGDTDMLQSINNWYKRNAKAVAKEANGYLADKFDAEKQLEQPASPTETESFKKWFKDSKVVDENGDPLVVYHGGKSNISKFNIPAFFTSDKEAADFFTQRGDDTGEITDVHLSLQNPLKINTYEGSLEFVKLAKKAGVNIETDIEEKSQGWVFFSEDIVKNSPYDGDNILDLVYVPEVVTALNAAGFDGVFDEDVLGNQSIPAWVVLNKTDVKSAIGNTGAFDPANPNILAQPTGQPTEKEGSITPEDVVTFLDNKTTGDKDKDAAIRRAVHEQFARGFETYLMEGKSPSVELRNAFRAFARWLSRIYQFMRGKLDVKLDKEIRQVFDRLLATEEQVAAAEARARVEPMFTDAAMAGMTEEEFSDYQIRQEKVKDVQSETLRDKIIKQLTRQTKAWWKEEKQDIIDEEIDLLSKEQVYKARTELKDGAFKIDHATVKEMIGEEKTNKLGKKSVVIPPVLRGMTAKGMQGVHPDEAAAFFGYKSGSEMLNDLVNAPAIKDAAETRAESRMVDRHGDILNDGTIQQEADEAIQSEERGKLILHELKMIARGTNAPTVDRATIKALAEANIGKLSFRQIHPGKYRKAEIRAAQEAARMLAEGNKEGAASAKMRQVMNYYLGMAATNAKNDTVKIIDRMSRYNKKKVRESIMKVEGGYWDQIVKILNRFEFRKSASLKDVESLNVWVKERTESNGDGLVLSNAVLNESFVTHWKNVPFTDLQGINDSVKNIEHVARYSDKMTTMQEEIDYNNLKAKWIGNIENQGAKFKTKESRSRIDDSRKATLLEHIQRWQSQLTKVPFLAAWLDGGERAGLSHDILVQPFTDALDAKMTMIDEVATPIIKAIAGRDKADIARHNRSIFIPEIDDTLSGDQIIAVALNTGNQGNLKKLLLGEGWADPEVDTDITFDNPKLQAVLAHMTLSDWNLVQQIWDQMDTLYPQLAEVHRRTTGLTPPKVEATQIVNEFGTFRGGYYPVKYSPKRSHKAEKNDEKREAETESMFNNTASVQASVNTGATNERTGFYDRIFLSLDVVPDHFNETIHYITHHDAVRQVNRLIQAPDVANAITAVMGESEFKELKPWLNDIAKDGRQQPVKTFIDEAFHRLRFGTTLGVMGFKATTGIMQLFGILTTASELGPGPTIKGIQTVVGRSFYMKAVRNLLGSRDDMQTGWDFAAERSKVLPHRVQTMDREIKNAMSRLSKKSGKLAAIQEVSMKHIALIQTYMVDLPTWHAAYEKHLSENGDEKKAVQFADVTLENTQGSGATKDMARIMRNQSKIHTTFTMFMTFFSSLGNLTRDLVRGTRSGQYSMTSAAAKAMFLFTLPVFFEMLMRGELDEPDDEDERMNKFLTSVALYPIQSVPFVRDIASGALSDFGYNSSPVAAMMERGISSGKGLVENILTDEEITKSQLKNVSKLAGAAIGVPGINQMWSTGEHLYEVIEEGEDFTARELLFGPDRE